MMDTATDTHTTLQISDNATRRIAALLKEESPETRFRIAVLGGGCSGFQYKFDFDTTTPANNDLIIEKDGAVVVVDDVSLPLLAGSVIDFVETLGSAGFEIRNPNSTSRCGCGNSFSL